MNARTIDRRNLLAGIAVLVGILVLGATAIYAVASATATSMGADFTTAETTGHSRIVGFANAWKQATEEHESARAACAQLAAAARKQCVAEAIANQQRSRAAARDQYSAKPVVTPVLNAEPVPRVDTEFYRVHRQWPQ